MDTAPASARTSLQRSGRIIGVAGWSGAGKTTLLEKLIPVLNGRMLSVSTLKNAHHAFDLDTPGKDSWRHREAGAHEVLVASGKRWALLHDLRGEAEPSLLDLVAKFAPVDLILVEGFKTAPFPKIEVHRAANGKPYLYPEDAHIVALASDAPVDARIAICSLDDVEGIADLVVEHALALESFAERIKTWRRP